MSDELRRRAAEWRDIEFNLDKIAEHIKAKFGEKWPDDNDKQTLKIISEYLNVILRDVRVRFSDVLRAQVVETFAEAKNEQVY